MKISELENCPDWLKEADTEDADVDIFDGVVHWYKGVWWGGTWEGGVWKGGVWEGGTWENGNWERG